MIAVGTLVTERQSYDLIELLRPRVDACVFRLLKSRAFDRKEFVETGSQVLLAPKMAREVALQVLADVPASESEATARQVARCILNLASRDERLADPATRT
jgi:CRISPR/Cas system-associated endonuclease Cas1